jgi:F-type H+-transporting ATPase subunit a
MEHGFTWLGTIGHLEGGWQHLAGAVLVTLLLLAFGVVVRSRFADPERAIAPEDGITVRNVAEAFVEAIIGIAKSAIPHHAEHYVPLLATFFVFIFVANVLGLVPGFAPPTSSFNVTFALGLVSFGAYHAYGVKAQGLKSYLKHFLGPVMFLAPLMATIEIVSHSFRPVSLGVRLFGNMFADHEVINVFTDLTHVLIPVAFYALGFFVCLLQSFVFTMLSAIYISGAVTHEDELEDIAE